MRPIDADVLYEKFKNGKSDTDQEKDFNLLGRYMVRKAPTISLDSLVKHGEWIEHWESVRYGEECYDECYCSCSICGYLEEGETKYQGNYCRDCGAKMEARNERD